MSDTPDALSLDNAADGNNDDDAPRRYVVSFTFDVIVTATPSTIDDDAANYADAVADFVSDGGPVGVVAVDVVSIDAA